MTLKRAVPILLKTSLSIALIVLVARRVDLGLVWAHLGAVKVGLLAFGSGLVVVQIVIGALRWQAIMTAEGGGVAALTTLRIYFIGAFFNMWAPGAVVGDVLRTWYACRVGLTVSAAISSVVLDRVVVVVSLVFVTAFTQSVLPPVVQSQPQVLALIDIARIAAILSVVGLGALLFLDRLPAVLHAQGLIRRLLLLSLNARRVLLRPAALAWVLFLALAGQVILSLAIYELALSLDLRIGLLDCIVLMQPVILFSFLPVSIGGWGVREGTMVFMLGLIGVAPEKALLLSVMVGLVGMAMSLPGGLLWLASRDVRAQGALDGAAAVRS